MNSVLTQNIKQMDRKKSLSALEEGVVLFFPDYSFPAVETALLSESVLQGKHKNLSYDIQKKQLGAFNKEQLGAFEEKLTQFMHAYAEFAKQLIQEVLPAYLPHLKWGRTSYRPAQISGRTTSKRKDDRRLHVDSFAATPVHGLRILRVFCNINPFEEARVWHLGEPLPAVLNRFAPKIPAYSKFRALLLKKLGLTKTLRSAYDHYMLSLHNQMKLDDEYQAQVPKTRFEFPAHSTWIVFTDRTSHAALSGQYLLEQTFYLPVDKMSQPELAPLNEWKKFRSELVEG